MTGTSISSRKVCQRKLVRVEGAKRGHSPEKRFHARVYASPTQAEIAGGPQLKDNGISDDQSLFFLLTIKFLHLQ